MAKRLQKEIERLKNRILSLGAMVEERVWMAIKATETLDADLAEEIINKDYEIDETEIEVEEECLKILALHQPVAVDLRFLIVVIKINNDLERIGDQAVNIAMRVRNISKSKRPRPTFGYTEMANKSASMVRMSLDALVNLDVDLAFQVITLDDEVDHMQRETYDQVKEALKENPQFVRYLINFYTTSRHLERIADLSTNIAEEVIYLIEGEIVRHGRGESEVRSSKT